MNEEQGTAPIADVAPATAEAPKPETPEVPAIEAEAAPVAPQPEKKTDPRQRKIAELSYELREQRRQMDRLLGVVETQAKSRAPQEAEKPPRIEDFSTIDEYVDAKLEYREKGKARQAEPEPTQQHDSRADTVIAQRDELLEVGSGKFEDFEEVVFKNRDVRITPTMADAILNLDDAEAKAELAYYLAKNPKEALQISRLAPSRQAAEIGKLEMRLAVKPEPKKPSAAPAPITPVGGNSTPSDEIAPVMDYEKFVKIRNKQLGRK